ncbi:hypothetical protein [Naasia sp. SYSU D00057]|uniref:hypothetical protein n=1 Tax=Naasia sp. SYSU D00057 TaxID=2817380 RepID=UPI001B30488F|nr:hypothetical protein [Naasia sp. SYSU D00057]
MPWWGIVLIGLGAWMLISVVLGVVIGRAVKVAETHRKDEEFVRTLGRGSIQPPRADAWPPVAPEKPVAPRRSAAPQSPLAHR